MSDAVIDSEITARLAVLAEQEKPDPYELKRIMDECSYYSLASDSMMIAMHSIWEILMKELYP